MKNKELKSAPKNIKAFVFDMDGVLLDTESICDKTWEIAGKEFGLPEEDSNRVIALCRGQNKSDTILTLKREFGENFDGAGFLARTSELFHEVEFSVGIKRMYYAKEALSTLKQKYPIALASSTRKESVIRQLTNAGLIDYFDAIVTGDMVTHSKPDPEIYLTAVRELSKKLETANGSSLPKDGTATEKSGNTEKSSCALSPSDCVAIEDSPNGLKSAHSAGLFTVMIPDRIQPTAEILEICDAVLGNLEELVKFADGDFH